MKFFMVLLLATTFGLNAQAKTSEYYCEFSKSLQMGEAFEDINDFLFSDYPNLVIYNVGDNVTSVSVGALSYDESEFEFTQVVSAVQTVIHVTRPAEEGFPAYRSLSLVFPNDGSKTAIVLSYEKELEGLVAQFENCK